jgi:hypothetical protein
VAAFANSLTAFRNASGRLIVENKEVDLSSHATGKQAVPAVEKLAKIGSLHLINDRLEFMVNHVRSQNELLSKPIYPELRIDLDSEQCEMNYPTVRKPKRQSEAEEDVTWWQDVREWRGSFQSTGSLKSVRNYNGLVIDSNESRGLHGDFTLTRSDNDDFFWSGFIEGRGTFESDSKLADGKTPDTHFKTVCEGPFKLELALSTYEGKLAWCGLSNWKLPGTQVMRPPGETKSYTDAGLPPMASGNWPTLPAAPEAIEAVWQSISSLDEVDMHDFMIWMLIPLGSAESRSEHERKYGPYDVAQDPANPLYCMIPPRIPPQGKDLLRWSDMAVNWRVYSVRRGHVAALEATLNYIEGNITLATKYAAVIGPFAIKLPDAITEARRNLEKQRAR